VALTSKQQQFVHEYLIDRNATQAAIRAGYSAKTAYSIGDENLRKPEIAQAMEAATAKQAERLELTADDVKREAWAIARDLGHPPAARVSALALLSKLFREFSDKQEHTGKDGEPLAVLVEGRLGGR